MAEEKTPGTDSTGTERTLAEMGTPPRNPWLERRPRPASAGEKAEGETEAGGSAPPARPGG